MIFTYHKCPIKPVFTSILIFIKVLDQGGQRTGYVLFFESLDPWTIGPLGPRPGGTSLIEKLPGLGKITKPS
jgi:hypothetical protein